jgi:hypothetical protein
MLGGFLHAMQTVGVGASLVTSLETRAPGAGGLVGRCVRYPLFAYFYPQTLTCRKNENTPKVVNFVDFKGYCVVLYLSTMRQSV